MPTAEQHEVSDTSIDQLVLDVRTRGKHGLSTGIGDMLTDGHIEQTMIGSSALFLDLIDKDYVALNSGVFGTRVRVDLDGAAYRLTEVSLVDTERLRLQFELWLISEMREHKRPLKAKRDSKTRAEFILQMLRELKSPYSLVCPELHRKQAVRGATPQEIAQTVEGLGSSGRGAAVSKEANIEGKPLNKAQAKIVDEALAIAEQLSAPPKAMLALVEALIVESTITNTPTGDKDSVGVLQVRRSTARGIQAQSGHGTLDPMNVGEVVTRFLETGFWNYGGAIKLANQNPSWTAGEIAQHTQGSAYPKRYDEHKKEAEEMVRQFAGGGLSFNAEGTGESSPTAETATYEYARGKPGEPEDTFTCALRLAEEVLWRFFVVARKSGKPAIYYVQDDDLIRAKPRYIISPDSAGVEKVTFDAEVGKRLIVVRNRRQPKPSEAQLEVRMGRWQAPPGTVIELADYGPGDGKWLVETVERNLYDAKGTVHLRAPQKALGEPRPQAGEGESPTASKATSGQKSKLAAQHPELKAGVRDVVATILAQYPTLVITSTLRAGDTGSYHAVGRACDIAGDEATMNAAARWIAQNLTTVLTEGIHQPGLSVKDGVTRDPSFWGEKTWNEHKNHIHVAV